MGIWCDSIVFHINGSGICDNWVQNLREMHFDSIKTELGRKHMSVWDLSSRTQYIQKRVSQIILLFLFCIWFSHEHVWNRLFLNDY
jgi:hypothetical protein